MMPLNATLAIVGVYTVLIAWIFIAALTRSWWTPFKEVQRLARGGVTAPLPKSVPDALIATLILLFTQGCWCIFTFGQLITLSMATDSSEDPHRSVILTHALLLWSLITVLGIIGGIKHAATCYDSLRQIGLFPKEFRPRMRRGHLSVKNTESAARRLARPRDNYRADIESVPGYGSFYDPAEDQDYDRQMEPDYPSDNADIESDPGYETFRDPSEDQNYGRRTETESYFTSDHRRSRILVSRPFVPGCRECAESRLLELAAEQGDPHQATMSLPALPPSPPYDSPTNESQSELSDADDEREEVEHNGTVLERARG